MINSFYNKNDWNFIDDLIKCQRHDSSFTPLTITQTEYFNMFTEFDRVLLRFSNKGR